MKMDKPSQKQDINIAKGIAIVLVVISHIMAREHSPGNEWFDTLNANIYLFHMPFFVFLSGYLHFKPGRLERLSKDKKTYFKKQSIRLLLPFFFMGIFVLVGKFAMKEIMHVSNVPSDFLSGFVNLFWETRYSASLFVWYILAIFVYSITSLFIYKIFKDRIYLWLALGLVIFFIPPIKYLYLNKLLGFYFFFCIGLLLITYEEKYLSIIHDKRKWIAIVSCFFLIIALFQSGYLDQRLAMLIAGSLSIPAIHGLCFIILDHCKNAKTLFMYLGGMAFSIYLFNNITIGLTKGILFKFMTWDYGNFFIVAPLLVLGGLIGPILIEKIFLNRIPFIKNQILRN